jgi:putative SOS response-associated peptidase YedK
LIPTDSFYEWQAGAASGPKQPYFVRAKRGDSGAPPPLAFAGLWETWTGPNGEELDTAAIVTTDANRTLSAIHPRMPAFITAADFDRWLDCDAVPAEEAAALIKPADDALLEVYPISPAVNRVANDSEALIASLSGQAAAEQAAPQQPRQPSRLKKSDDQPTLF